MSDEELSREALYGVYRAVVTDIRDPEVRGRVNVRLETGQEAWAELATLPAGDGYGTWLRPDPDDEVLLAFEGGDPRRPYVLGALWGRGDRPPETGEGAATVKTIRTRCGATITSTTHGVRCESRLRAESGSSPEAGSRRPRARSHSTRTSSASMPGWSSSAGSCVATR
jgi:uncharacterized protein involved in type VI secretion and phage assembly